MGTRSFRKHRTVFPFLQHLIAPVSQQPQPGLVQQRPEPVTHQRQKRPGICIPKRHFFQFAVIYRIDLYIDLFEFVHGWKGSLPRLQFHQEDLAERNFFARNSIDLQPSGDHSYIFIFIRQTETLARNQLHQRFSSQIRHQSSPCPSFSSCSRSSISRR